MIVGDECFNAAVGVTASGMDPRSEFVKSDKRQDRMPKRGLFVFINPKKAFYITLSFFVITRLQYLVKVTSIKTLIVGNQRIANRSLADAFSFA